jgi:acyl-coenzyme A synthetase/AMP-(fatty) acid ligase
VISLEVIRHHADRHPDRPAIIDGANSASWIDLQQTVQSVRNWMACALSTVRAQDTGRAAELRVVGYAGNTVEFVVAIAAAASLGVAWVGIDPSRDLETSLHQLSAVNPDLLIVDSALTDGAHLAEQARRKGLVILDLAANATDDAFTTSYATARAGRTPVVHWEPPPFLALGFTSGSTGRPKLFLRRTRSENQRNAYLRDTFNFSGDNGDVYLVTSPLAHASGHVWANAALSLGGTVVLGGGDPDTIVRQITEHRVSAAFMVPPTLEAFLDAAIGNPGADLSSLRALLTGGRHISARAIRQATSRLGPVLHLYYATTETGINTFANPAQLATNPLTAGYPLAGVRLLIVDEHTRQPLPPETPGLIAIASSLNLDGYQSGQPNTIAWNGHEHVLTSDYGYLARDGQLFILGRSDSLPGGDHLNVVALEAELKELPDVQDACIVRQATTDGIEVTAVVRVSDEARGNHPLERVTSRLGELLNSPVPPPRALAVPRIPYNTAGKVDVRALNALLTDRAQPPLAVA